MFMIGFSIGFGCIPFLLMGELFPTAQRGLLSSVAGSFNLAVMFIVLRTYHPIDEVMFIKYKKVIGLIRLFVSKRLLQRLAHSGCTQFCVLSAFYSLYLSFLRRRDESWKI